MQPTIIEAALSGAGGKARNPNMPVTPDEIAANVIACIEAGAGIVHNHIEAGYAGEAAAARYGEGWRPALAKHPEAILYGTVALVGEGVSLENYAHFPLTVREHGARMGVLDPGSVNLTVGRPDGLPDPVRSASYTNSFAMLDAVLTMYAEAGIPSSIAVYEPSFLRATLAYERAGRLAPGTMVKLYFGGGRSFLDGAPGVSFGLPPTVKALEAYLEMMQGSKLPWAAAVLGGDILEAPEFAEAVLARGGHLRVGLEDYAGEATPSNAELVARAAALAARCGRPAATPAQTAEMLGMSA